MNTRRILSFEMSQKVNDAEIEQVSAGDARGTVQVSYDPVSGTKHISFDN